MAALLWPHHRQLANFTQTTSEEQRRQATSELVDLGTEISDSSNAPAQQGTMGGEKAPVGTTLVGTTHVGTTLRTCCSLYGVATSPNSS